MITAGKLLLELASSWLGFAASQVEQAKQVGKDEVWTKAWDSEGFEIKLAELQAELDWVMHDDADADRKPWQAGD